jgi:chemotaxis protein histidine kinase CheA
MLGPEGNGPQHRVQDLQGLQHRLRGQALAPPSLPGGRLCRIAVRTRDADRASAQVVGLFGEVAGLGELLSVDRCAQGGPVFVVRTGAGDHELMDLLAMHVERDCVSIESVSAVPAAGQAVFSDDRPDRDGGGATVRVDALELRRLVAQARALESCDGVFSETMDAGSAADRWRRDVQSICRGIEALGSAPVSSLFERVSAALQRLSAQLHRPFELSVTGGDIRIDRSVLQALVSPVLHLLRNACDHGIEPAACRSAAGKPQAGQIAVSAWREPGQFRMSVRDDGAGLSRDSLLQAARVHCIAVPADPTDQEVWALVFAPGLSTADTVGDVSGRGVGMDAVKRQVEALGGQVAIVSATGKGVCVTISIPMGDVVPSAVGG